MQPLVPSLEDGFVGVEIRLLPRQRRRQFRRCFRIVSPRISQPLRVIALEIASAFWDGSTMTASTSPRVFVSMFFSRTQSRHSIPEDRVSSRTSSAKLICATMVFGLSCCAGRHGRRAGLKQSPPGRRFGQPSFQCGQVCASSRSVRRC